MKWQDLRSSDNVEDRRGMSPAGGFGGFGGGGMIRTGGLGIGGLLILLVVSYLFGIDPLSLLSPDQSSPGGYTSAPATDEASLFAQQDPRRYRRHVGRDLRALGSTLFPADAGALQ